MRITTSFRALAGPRYFMINARNASPAPENTITASATSTRRTSSAPGSAPPRGTRPACKAWRPLRCRCSARCGRCSSGSSVAASPSARYPVAFDGKSLDDYVDVAERIADFRELYPKGTLQPVDPGQPWEQAVVTGVDKNGKQFTATMIVYKAAAYRTPDDTRPGIGVAWEVSPGRTPYPLGSELMNAETSAWGRAIIAVLASDSKRGVASRQEVQNRRAERDDGLPVNADGSLSRSRTTDAEKEQAGVMTSVQQAEHTALRKGADGKLPAAEQGSRTPMTPCDDPFYDTAPNGKQPPAEDRPGTADAEQIREVNIRLTSHGLTKRDERLAYLAEQFGREFHSTSEMAYSEAAKVLREMPARPKAIAP